MDDKLQTVFIDLMSSIIEAIPQLLAGVALIGCGWALGWIVKRLVIHLAIILKIGHYLTGTRWKAAFEKADVRYGFYNFLGNISFIIVFLIFLDLALLAWNIKVLSEILGKIILFFPRFLATAVILGFGLLVARWASHALLQQLTSLNVPYASIIVQYARMMMVVLFTAISLMQLDVAREIILIGFATIFIMLGMIAVILSVMGGKQFLLNQKESTEKSKVMENDESSH